MKRFGVLFLSASLAVTMTACGSPPSTNSSNVPDAYTSSHVSSGEDSSATPFPGSQAKTETLYAKLVEQVEMGNYYAASHTYQSGGSALAEYQDAAAYDQYARALFLYHSKESSCLGQPYFLLDQIPADFLSTAQVKEEIQALVSPYEGVYTMSQNGVRYRISIHNGLLSFEVMTSSSGNLGNYQSQLIQIEDGSDPVMYSTNLNYTGRSDLNYRLRLEAEGQSLVVENAEDSPFDVFVGTYEKISDTALDSRK